MALSLAALADLAEEEGRSTVDLLSPRVRFQSVGHSDLDACLDWFAELIMTVDIDDADDVVVGSLDFTVIRLGTEDPIAMCLDQFDGDHEMLAGLFDGNQLAEQVEAQYETLTVVTEAVLIPNITFVTELAGPRPGTVAGGRDDSPDAAHWDRADVALPGAHHRLHSRFRPRRGSGRGSGAHRRARQRHRPALGPLRAVWADPGRISAVGAGHVDHLRGP